MVATNGYILQNANFAIGGSTAAMFLESNRVTFSAGSETAALQSVSVHDT